MSIRYECEHCGSVLKIKDDLAGKPGKCPKCKTGFTVPELSEVSDSSSEVAAESSDDSAPMLAESKSSGPDDDFDVNAFLSGDDDSPAVSKRKATKTPRTVSTPDEGSSPNEPGEKPKKKSVERNVAAEKDEDAFEIRRGPDAVGKRKPMDSPGMEGDESDENVVPSRRPPGTNANAPAANIASDLLSKSAKKGKKSLWGDVAHEAKNTGEDFDWSGLWFEVRTKLLPIVGGGAAVLFLLYWFVYPMFGSKSYVPKLGQVTGVVTANGKPLAGALVWFHPDHRSEEIGGKNFKVTASIGMTDANGHYEMGYDTKHKGVVLGKCRIEIRTADNTGISSKFYVNDKEAVTKEVKEGKQVVILDVSP